MAVMNTEWSDNSDYGYNIHTNPAGDNTCSSVMQTLSLIVDSSKLELKLNLLKIKHFILIECGETQNQYSKHFLSSYHHIIINNNIISIY